MRVLMKGNLPRGAWALLAIVLALQLLTSFYLAYFLTFSLGVLTQQGAEGTAPWYVPCLQAP